MLLSDRELFTVLAALRLWQEEKDEPETIGSDLIDTATNFGEIDLLDDAEIDSLCEGLCTTADDANEDVEREIAAGERAIHESDIAASTAGYHRQGI